MLQFSQPLEDSAPLTEESKNSSYESFQSDPNKGLTPEVKILSNRVYPSIILESVPLMRLSCFYMC